MDKEIPIGLRMFLHKSGKFHGSFINLGYNNKLTGQNEYKYVHKGQTFYICAGFFFYESGNIESFFINCPANGTRVGNPYNFLPLETNFPLEGKKLLLFSHDGIVFYDESGLPKKVIMSNSRNSLPPNYAPPAINLGEDYNVIEISETGKITSAILVPRPNYDFN
ncbi:MAG: hypothetical protein FWC03_10250 [Treponema sp.]|nr:hypothetical protein [Treponema sp.]